MGSQVLLASTSSNVLLGRGFEKAFNECLGVSDWAFIPCSGGDDDFRLT